MYTVLGIAVSVNTVSVSRCDVKNVTGHVERENTSFYFFSIVPNRFLRVFFSAFISSHHIVINPSDAREAKKKKMNNNTTILLRCFRAAIFERK
jgi:hypothetical protein